MTWTSDQIPSINFEEEHSYPEIDPKILLQMDPSTFNNWRREFDFPRIVKYIKGKLPLFDIWQKEQNVLYEDLLFFGPARFIRKNDGKIFMTKSDHQNQVDKKRLFINQVLLSKYQKKPKFYGNIEVLKEITPYLDWILKRKDKPKYYTENSLFRNSGKSFIKNSSKFVFDNELRILNLGSIYKKGNIIATPQMILGSKGGFNNESKILEFINFDYLTIQDQFWNGESFVFFSSFSNVNLINTGINQIHFYKTELGGLKISDSTLNNLIFENSKITPSLVEIEIIERSEINYCIFKNTDFFRYYNFIKIRDSKFLYTINASINYSTIKNLYSFSGDFYNSSKYYYLEKKNELYEKSKLISYIKENQLVKFKDSNLVYDSLKYFAFKNQNLEQKRLIFRYYVIFCLYAIGHYSILLTNWINYLGRGFGERPFRILLSFLPLILIFSLINTQLEVYDSFGQLVIDNSFNMLGKFELDQESKLNSIFRVLKAALGVFLISLFVADLSSKKRY